MKIQISSILSIFLLCNLEAVAAVAANDAKPSDNSASSAAGKSSTPVKSPQKKASSSNNTKRHNSFVPPPPPTVPTLSQMGTAGANIIFMGENVELMPLADLKDLQTKTQTELAKARRSLEEEITVASEKKQRADSFDQLYAEGVVSRRELETSKTENEKATEDLQDAKSLVYNLEQKYSRIEKRLAELDKAKKQDPSSTKSASKHNTKR